MTGIIRYYSDLVPVVHHLEQLTNNASEGLRSVPKTAYASMMDRLMTMVWRAEKVNASSLTQHPAKAAVRMRLAAFSPSV